MGRPTMYWSEVRERAVRMVSEYRGDHRCWVGGDLFDSGDVRVLGGDVAVGGFGRLSGIRVLDSSKTLTHNGWCPVSLGAAAMMEWSPWTRGVGLTRKHSGIDVLPSRRSVGLVPRSKGGVCGSERM